VARKLVRLNIKETSGVDHPAHLTEGWVVMKSAELSEVTAVLDEVRPVENINEDTPDDASASSVSKTEGISMSEITAPIDAVETVVIPESATEAEIVKAMPDVIKKMLDDSKAIAESALRKAQASEEALIAERNARADEAAVLKAAQWSQLTIDPTIVGPALRELSEVNEGLASEIVKALDSANALLEANVVFTEVGSDASVTTDDAYSKMESLAKAAVASGTAPSFESALQAVAQSNPDLYTSYLNEKGR